MIVNSVNLLTKFTEFTEIGDIGISDARHHQQIEASFNMNFSQIFALKFA